MAEHRLAAKWAGLTWDAWLALPGDPWASRGGNCKAKEIAAYRMSTTLEAMANED